MEPDRAWRSSLGWIHSLASDVERFCYAVVVDNTSNDGSFIPAQDITVKGHTEKLCRVQLGAEVRIFGVVLRGFADGKPFKTNNSNVLSSIRNRQVTGSSPVVGSSFSIIYKRTQRCQLLCLRRA